MNEHTCWSCDGTGIGDPHAETACSECNGTGELNTDDDWDEPTGFPPLNVHPYYDGTGRGGW